MSECACVSVGVYETGLRTGLPVLARYDDGSTRELDLARWCGPARGADDAVLEAVTGSVLDIGCGPGRMLRGLRRRGHAALGIDISAAAIALAREQGGEAVLCSVFDDVPGAGTWDSVLLVDGNIGIGGNPARLLRRSVALLAADGRVLVELGPPLSHTGSRRVRLETGQGTVGAWFRWADVSVDAVTELAQSAAMTVLDVWSLPEPHQGPSRWFAVLGAL